MNRINNRKLILIEGLPGTGKTTLSDTLFQYLRNQNKPAVLLQEADNIPSNFSGIVGVPHHALEGALNNLDYITKTENYTFFDLISNNPDEETHALLHPYDLGDALNTHISAQQYAHITLEWWRYWVNKNIGDHTLIIESAFLQCPINEMIFRKASDADVTTYIHAIAEIIRPFDPICIYLRRQSAEAAINFAKKVKSEAWGTRVDAFLAALDCTNVFERRFTLEQSLLPLVDHIVCDINGHDWSDVEVKLQ